jgi:hypothetical protein
VRPEETGNGATPAWRAKYEFAREALGTGGAADQRCRGEGAETMLCQQRRPVGDDQRAQPALQRVAFTDMARML